MQQSYHRTLTDGFRTSDPMSGALALWNSAKLRIGYSQKMSNPTLSAIFIIFLFPFRMIVDTR